jgi:alkylhydroperoxidase family enzyme
MTILPLADLDTLEPHVREAYEKVPGKLNIHRLWALAPETFIPGRRYSASVVKAPQLGPRNRQLVILVTAILEDGEYEWAQHEPVARKCGVTDEEIAAIEARRLDDPVFDESTRLLLAFVSELVLNAGAGEALVRKAQDHYTPGQLMEAILLCCLYMTVTRVARTAGLEPEAGTGALANVGQVDAGSSFFQ